MISELSSIVTGVCTLGLAVGYTAGVVEFEGAMIWMVSYAVLLLVSIQLSVSGDE